MKNAQDINNHEDAVYILGKALLVGADLRQQNYDLAESIIRNDHRVAALMRREERLRS